VPARILIVEDDADARDMLTTLLTGEGFDTLCAEDGQSGLELASSKRPDVILTDVHMPNIDGVAMIRMLRQQPHTKDIPIVVMSAYGSTLMSEAMSAGANGMLNKPAQLSHLVKMIKGLLKAAPAISLIVGSSLCLCVV
jgi:CheY-like chemotaxis protein